MGSSAAFSSLLLLIGVADIKCLFPDDRAFHPLVSPCGTEGTVCCGGHAATSCAECPYDEEGHWMGGSWCNGVCVWDSVSSECVSLAPSLTCGSGEIVESCDSCSGGEVACEGASCSWMPYTELCRPHLTEDTRTASVHLFFNHPAKAPRPSWWFNTVTILDTADATFFAAIGNSFGYGGVQQVDADLTRYIFSIWDQGGCDQDFDPSCDPELVATTIACGEGVVCQGFGGEGTGRQSLLDIAGGAPLPGEKSHFAVQAVPVFDELSGEATRMQYTGFFFSEAIGRWRLLSRIEVSTGEEDWWIGFPYAFVEQWSPVDTLTTRGGAFGPSWMAGSNASGADAASALWYPLPSATFSHGTLENHKHVNAFTQPPDNSVAIETGGNVVQSAEMNTEFAMNTEAPMPDELLLLDSLRECLGTASTAAEIESCLDGGDEKPIVPFETFDNVKREAGKSLKKVAIVFKHNDATHTYTTCKNDLKKPPSPKRGTKYKPSSDNDALMLELDSSPTGRVTFFGQEYSKAYVGTDGYISFGGWQGDIDSPPADNHFLLPRISGLLTDLDPTLGGKIKYKLEPNELIVNYLKVPQKGNARKKNTFQVGINTATQTITLHYSKIKATSQAVIGLSNGTTPFNDEVSFSDLPGC